MVFISYYYFFKVHIYFLWYYRFLMAVRVIVPIVNSEKSLLLLSLFTHMLLLPFVNRSLLGFLLAAISASFESV